MNTNWKILTLNDVCEKITDGAHNSPISVENGKPMASVKDLTRFGIDLTDARLIAEEEFDKLVKQGCQPLIGDVLIAKDGNSALDTVCTVNEHIDAVLLSSVAILRPDKKKLDSDFLKYYFCSKQVIEYLKNNFISGAAIPRVVLKDFRKAEINVPPIETQKKISTILRTFDNKIELNTQTNQTLEAIAQAIFKSWFVDFEPVKAKMAVLEAGGTDIDAEHAAMSAISGKDEAALSQLQTDQPDAYDELAQTAALFPSAMQDSELGEIPAGWNTQRLESLIELAYGKALKSTDRIEGTVPVYGSGGINGTHCKALVPGAGVIIGRKGTVGSIYWEQNDFFPIDTTFYVKTKENVTLEFAFYLLQTLGLNDMNTDAAVPGLNRNNVYRLEVPGFPDELIIRFTDIVGDVSKAIQNLKVESNQLAEIRDSILPKLLSGELTLPQAENAAS